MTQAELNEARELRDLMRNEERRLNAYRLAAQNLVPLLDGMPHARNCAGKPEKIALLIVESELKLIELNERYDAACDKLARKIKAEIADGTEQEILLLRYVACMNFRDIEIKLDMSDARIFYLHRNGIKKLK